MEEMLESLDITFLLCPLLSVSLPFREREHPRFADACGRRNDESHRVHKSSQIHTWHGNWVRLGPDLLCKHMAVVFG